jgi:hypothetical protein
MDDSNLELNDGPPARPIKRTTQLGVKESKAIDINITTATRYYMIDSYPSFFAVGQYAKCHATRFLAASLCTFVAK